MVRSAADFLGIQGVLQGGRLARHTLGPVEGRDKPGMPGRHLVDDAEAVVVLIKDGVFLDIEAFEGKKIYAMDEDVKRRGMEGRLKDKAEIIGYDKLVDLILENKVVNFV